MSRCFIPEDELREALGKIPFWRGYYYNRYGDLLSDSDVEEAATHAVVVAWQKFDRDSGAKFATYADACIKYTLIGLIRGAIKKKEKEVFLDVIIEDEGRNSYIVDPAKNQLDAIIAKEDDDWTTQFIERLKGLNRQSINFWILRYWYGFPQKTISEVYGIDHSSVSYGIKKANELISELYVREKNGETVEITPKFHGFARMKYDEFRMIDVEPNCRARFCF